MLFIDSINPSSESNLNRYRVTSYQSINDIISRGNLYFQKWSLKDVSKRQTYFEKFVDRLKSKNNKFVELISLENGKSLDESQQEVSGAINKVQLTIDAYYKRVVSNQFDSADREFHLNYKPLGVFVVLGPFNFPLSLPLGHILPALLAGNCVVFKPSEHTIGVGCLLMECFKQAGFPDDVIQCVIGSGKHGQKLISYPDIAGVLFTGGYKTAQRISKTLSKTPEKLLALECGGNNCLILSSYQHAKHVVDCLVRSAFLTAGQRCTCMQRLIVVRSKKNEAVIDQFINTVKQLSIGSFDDDLVPFMGPLISKQAVNHVMRFYKQMSQLKSSVLLPMKRLKRTGFFVSPGIIDTTQCYQDVPDEECFGPLLQIIFVNDFNDAIEVANRTAYGLSASLISKSKKEFNIFYNRVRAGVINWNQPTNGASSLLPFGGVGRSGNYRPAGFFAIDSCVYPVASVQNKTLL